jgi:hypothetical protein
MSQDLMVYAGAYIEITKLPKVWEEVEIESFNHPECKKKCDHSYLINTAKFCPSCGKPVEVVVEKLKAEKQWDMADLEHEFCEVFNWPNGMGWGGCAELDKVLMPHAGGKWGKYYEDNGFGILGKLPKLANPEGILKTKFSKDLAALEKIGAKYVIKSGILAYYI